MFQASLHAPHLCGPWRDGEIHLPSFRVFVDLDGVLCDFNKACIALFPEGGPIVDKMPTHTVTKLTRDEERQMWQRIEQEPNFFRDLPWTEDGETLWEWLRANISEMPTILTGLPYGRVGKMASKQKEQWCQEHLDPRVTVFCCGTRNKCKFSAPGCALIDDRAELRDAWEEQGGLFIHHTSAATSIKELAEALASLEAPGHLTPFELGNVCWDAQTPHGCFRPNCRFDHIPIAHTHRNWIRLWGFVWWNVRMFDDMEQLVQCVREVYAVMDDPTNQQNATKGEHTMADVETSGAQRRMRKVLCDTNALGFPFDFLGPTQCTIGRIENRVLQWVRMCAHHANIPGSICVVGSVALRIQVSGSDLDLVIAARVDDHIEPKVVLQLISEVMAQHGGEDVAVIPAATPVLRFSRFGISSDLTVNQMGSLRDVLLFRYALTPALEDVLMELKTWLTTWCIPGMKQGGYPTLVWLRMLVRYAQEQRDPNITLKEFFLNRLRTKLPTGSLAVAIEGEQPESGSARLAANVSAATFLYIIGSIRRYLNGGEHPTFHDALLRVGPWIPSTCRFFWGSDQVVTRTVIGVFGGPKWELRSCECAECTLPGAAALLYVSRRSEEWLMVCDNGEIMRPIHFIDVVTSACTLEESDFGDWLPTTAPKERYSRRLLLALRSSEHAAYGYSTEPRPYVSSEASADDLSDGDSLASAKEDDRVEQEESSTPALPAAVRLDASTTVAPSTTVTITSGPQRQGVPVRRNNRCNAELQVFIRNIPMEATEEDIFNVFYCYEPTNVKVIRNKQFADVRGFVTFHTAEEAQRAAKCKISIMGRDLYLSLVRRTHRTKMRETQKTSPRKDIKTIKANVFSTRI